MPLLTAPRLWLLLALAFATSGANTAAAAEQVTLLNVSYDVSRELFAQINPAFEQAWHAHNGRPIEIRQSHGGSSTQARAVAEGLQADVVTLNQVTDIEFLAKAGLVYEHWPSRFPNGASPYYSLPVLVVRAGNPKHIKDWDDLVRPDVHPVFPNPRTSGNGRYTYLAAYAYARERFGADDAKVRAFVSALLANVPVFDAGGRGASTTFVERGIGDVLITFESETNTLRKQYANAQLLVVYPSVSVRADFPVAVVDKNADRHGTRDAATAYLNFLYSEVAQDILARNFNRVQNPAVLTRYRTQFPDIRLISVEKTFGSWEAVTREHFGEGGILDQLLTANR